MGKKIIPKRKWRYPFPWEREYQRYMKSVAADMRNAVMQNWPQVQILLESNPLRSDGLEDDIQRVMNGIWQTFSFKFTEAGIKSNVQRLGRGIGGYNANEFREVMRSALQVDIFLYEPHLNDLLDMWVTENVQRIKSIPSKYFFEVESLVREAMVKGLLTEDIRKKIEDRYGINERHARLIARDQTGKINLQLTRHRQTSIGIEEYLWRTHKDERVRQEHRLRDGKIFRWDAPPYDGHPGEPIQCRCIAEPVIDLDKISVMGAA